MPTAYCFSNSTCTGTTAIYATKSTLTDAKSYCKGALTTSTKRVAYDGYCYPTSQLDDESLVVSAEELEFEAELSMAELEAEMEAEAAMLAGDDGLEVDAF
eukprot:tig00020710_g13326.t1